MSTLTLSPVSEAVYAALNVSAVTTLATGPNDGQARQGTAFPYFWYVVRETNARGMGTGGLRRIDLRVHAAAQPTGAAGPARQIEAILAAVVLLLEDATLTISGYRPAGQVFYSDTTEPVTSEINGVPCMEAFANFYFWVEP